MEELTRKDIRIPGVKRLNCCLQKNWTAGLLVFGRPFFQKGSSVLTGGNARVIRHFNTYLKAAMFMVCPEKKDGFTEDLKKPSLLNW